MGRLVLQRETALKSVTAQLGSRHPLAGRPRTQRGKHRFPPSATAHGNPPAGCDRRAPASAQRCDGPVATCCLFPCRGGRDWTEHSQRLEEHQERAWPGTVDGGTAGREHARWQGTADPRRGGAASGPGRPQPQNSPEASLPPGFPEASKEGVFADFPLFQVVSGFCLGPQGRGTWPAGVECRGKKFCSRLKSIRSCSSLPLPFLHV